MTSYLTIEIDAAKKLCDRLEFDASWDKAGPGYYGLKKQLNSSLLVGAGGFLAYSYASILTAMADRLTPEEDEPSVVNFAGAIQLRDELIAELTAKLKDFDTLIRLIANHPKLIDIPLERGPDSFSVPSILRDVVISQLKLGLNDIIVAYLKKKKARANPLKEYVEIVARLLGKWQAKNKSQRGTFVYRRAEELHANLAMMSKGDHVQFLKNEIRYFADRDFRSKNDLKQLSLAEEVLQLSGHVTRHRAVAKKVAAFNGA